ncbi:SGNH/GDSL hydrolase family protein [Aureitalea marina]|uniref:G-D-S-L family lipolytic protein n=1 Tax=Aureitalea marina TaxID=930804 RepID=A0A2S7KR63_9FLAO|nr:SGNH/GDSL hydrolase family protein [Aureitalea marina]PQB05115.1 G-D-S-L family lipolytic protein [Aureitalea marina]
MKKISLYSLLGLAVVFASCEPEFENAVTDEGFYTSGEANLGNFVAVGNSLTAGFADGTVYITGQNNSLPNIMASQFAKAGGGEFTQPLVNDNLGGLLLNGTQISQTRFVLSVDENGNPGPAILEGTPTTDVANQIPGPYGNMGIPGAKSFHLLAPGYGSLAGVANGTANPYYARIATADNATVAGDAASSSPSFFMLWIGNNDILGYATSGGAGVDQTGNLDPTTYGPNDITDPNVFASVYSQTVDALNASASGGVLFNIPDVTSIPYFTTVPAQSIPLDAATADFVNSNYALYNTAILPGLVSFGVITAEEAAARVVNFQAGINFPVMTDDDLTDISQVLQGPPFELDPVTAGLLGQLRQANETDLVTLPAASVLGAEAVPGDPTTVIGVAVPLADNFILTGIEQGRVAAAGAAYNATIEAVAAANGLAFVDARSALAEIASIGVPYEGGILTDDFVTGGGFSLDGVHPTPRGYAYAANLAIEAINRTYGGTIPQVLIGNYPTITAANN